MVVLGRRGRGGQERGGLHHCEQERQEEAEVEQDQVERIERTHCPPLSTTSVNAQRSH